MATVEDLQKQIVDMKEKTKAYLSKLKEDHENELTTIKQQNAVSI
jgi:Mg2+ and Co2+ transporter CorA